MRFLALGMSGLIALFFLFADLVNPPFVKNTLDLLEMKSLDFRFRLREAHQHGGSDADLALIAIDEKSIEEVGRWPWSRKEMARLLFSLAQGNPRLIAFDILFSEPEVAESLKLIRTLKSEYAQAFPNRQFMETLRLREREADADAKFAAIIEQTNRVVLPMAMVVPTEYQSKPGQASHSARDLPETPQSLMNASFGLVKRLSTEKIFFPIKSQAVIPPIPLLAQKAKAMGHVYYQPDRDGVLRWEYLVLKYGDEYYPSFGLQIARVSLGIPREEMKLWLGEAVEMGGIRIPTDERGRMLINYRGREGSLPTFSATDILHGRVSSDHFKGKIMLIGTTAIGTYDMKVTPLSANMPGVEKNATVVENILHQHFLRRTEAMKLLDAVFILFFGVSLWLILPRVRALLGVAVAGSMLAGYVLLAQYLFEQKGLWINLLYPSATIVLSYTFLTVLRFMTEERQAQEVRRIFSSYVSPKVVAELVKNPDLAKLGGQRKELTVLFSDIRGFTTFSEQHQPEDVVGILNEYMNAMTEVVFYWDGTLDKFVGDAIMVFWGAPMDQPNHAELAVRCALQMWQRLTQLQEKWRAEGKQVLDTGIGINTGEMVVGNMGAEGKKMDYTVIGDHVNLGARVESLTRQYNAHILITESTFEKIKDLIQPKEPYPNEQQRKTTKISHPERREKPMMGRAPFKDPVIGRVLFKDLDAVRVKGKEKPVRIFEVIELKRSDDET